VEPRGVEGLSLPPGPAPRDDHRHGGGGLPRPLRQPRGNGL